jgi:hypothetical protein
VSANTRESLESEISELLTQGVPENSIRIDESGAFGDSPHVCTVPQLRALIEEWQDGGDAGPHPDPDSLPTISEWRERNTD